MTTDTVTKPVSLRKLKEPKFLSLVEKGANRSAFKIIRDDSTKDDVKFKFAQREDNPLMTIYLPESVQTEQDAYDMLELFGLGEDYEVTHRTDMDGYMLVRKGQTNAEQGTFFDLGDGLGAEVATSSLAARSDDKGNGVVVTSIEFVKEHFAKLADVQAWLSENGVDFKENGVEVLDGGYIVTRHDAPDGLVTKKVPIQDGVIARIALAERADIPTGIVSPVSEYAYGNYGWGQLDFAAAMADPEFTNASWNALSTLGMVLEDIVFNGGLKLDERKVLIQRALGQYGDFMNGLLDALPKEVLVQIRSDKRNRKEFVMTKKTEAAPQADDKTTDASTEATAATDEATRSDAAGETTEEQTTESATAESTDEAARDDSEGETASDDAAASSESSESEFVTRAELEEVVNNAVASALSKREDATTTALSSITDTLGKLTESVEGIQRSAEETNTDLAKKLESIESHTVLRSDEDDDSQEPAAQGGTFSGVFGGFGSQQ